MVNKPSVKNIILIGIPTIISGLGVIMALDILKKYKNAIIFIVLLLLLIFVAFLLYYSKQEKEVKDEVENLKSTISSMVKMLNINSNTVISIVKLLENWNRDINKIANDINKDGFANEQDWNYENICNDICVCCKESIMKFVDSNEKTDLSVSMIKVYNNNGNDYIKMIAHSSPQTAKPDIYDKEELLSDCQYLFGRLIKDRNRDILALENNAKIQQRFYKPKPNTDLSKYNQYIAIPIMCHHNKILGILQVTTKYKYTIMNTEVELKKFSETYLTPFVDLLVLIEKIKKGLFVKPN